MTALPQHRMTVEEYLSWSESQEGRFELVNGVVFAQASERAAHSKMKLAVAMAFVNAIRRQGLSCHALPDGMAVRIGRRTAYEPDAMVYCGPELPPDALLVENPVIVVEVLSPSTGRNDATRKLAGYFSLASVRHYLIVDPDEPLVILHTRGEDGIVRMDVLTGGIVKLDPPGLAFSLGEIYAAGA